MDRTILHCDCNGFFASVECLSDSSLREVPMAVCGDPESRHGIILAKNELAKQFGIVTAETIWSALKKCPHLRLVRSHHSEYERYSKLVNAIYARYTDMVEPFGIDESWLDVTASRDLFGDGKQIADTLRRVVREELGLTISVGVSFNKTFAKLGSDYKKPDATTVILRDDVPKIVYPLPVQDLLFVGHAAAETLRKMGIRTIGDLAKAQRQQLVAALGKLGGQLSDCANGLENSPVRRIGEAEPVKSVGNGMTFPHDLVGMEALRAGALSLCDSVASRLRAIDLRAGGVQLTVRDPHFRSISRQMTLTAPTDNAQELLTAVTVLLQKHVSPTTPVRMLTVTATHLTDETAGEQLLLTDTPTDSYRRQRRSQLDRALDSIRQKYGKQAILHGSTIGEPEANDEEGGEA